MARARRPKVLYFFTIISWTATILGLVARGYLSAEYAGYALVAMVVVVAIASALSLSVAQVLLGIGLPCVSVVLLVIREGGDDPHVRASLATAVGALILALFGLYVLIR